MYLQVLTNASLPENGRSFGETPCDVITHSQSRERRKKDGDFNTLIANSLKDPRNTVFAQSGQSFAENSIIR